MQSKWINPKQIRVHARNMVRMTQEVANYHQVSHSLDSMIFGTHNYFDKEPEQNVEFSFIPIIVESIDSLLATGNSKKLVRTMDEIEKRYFNEEVVAKFKYSSATENMHV
ncbi:hypothetical protein MKX01_000996 [Papaver californicum]|nr:hypothetical protein MKX01_000996 [Papaver californicum]